MLCENFEIFYSFVSSKHSSLRSHLVSWTVVGDDLVVGVGVMIGDGIDWVVGGDILDMFGNDAFDAIVDGVSDVIDYVVFDVIGDGVKVNFIEILESYTSA